MKTSRWLMVATLLVAGTTFAQDAEKSPADLFKDLDRNADGVLGPDEIPESRKRFFDRLVRVGDDNDDGKLSRSEFEKATSQDDNRGGTSAGPPRDGARRRPPGGNLPTPEQMMERLDRNKDGKLTKNELPEFLRDRLGRAFDELGKDALTVDDLAKLRRGAAGRPGQPQPRDGDRPRPDAARREPRRPDGAPQQQQNRQFRPAFFRMLDTDEDGMLSRAELEKAATILERLDQNGDGKLGLGELFGARQGRPDGASGRPGRPDSSNSTGRRRRPGSPEGRPRPDSANRPGRPGGDRPSGQRGNPEANFRQLDRNGDGAISKEEAPERLKENFDRVDINKDGKVTVEELRQVLQRRSSGRPRPGDSPRNRRPQRDAPNRDTSA